MQASLVAQWVESACNAGRLQEIQVWSLGWEDPLEKVMATLSCILAWRIPWTEKPGGLQSLGLQRIRPDFVTKHQLQNAPSLLHFTEIIFFYLPFTENMQNVSSILYIYREREKERERESIHMVLSICLPL